MGLQGFHRTGANCLRIETQLRREQEKYNSCDAELLELKTAEEDRAAVAGLNRGAWGEKWDHGAARNKKSKRSTKKAKRSTKKPRVVKKSRGIKKSNKRRKSIKRKKSSRRR